MSGTFSVALQGPKPCGTSIDGNHLGLKLIIYLEGPSTLQYFRALETIPYMYVYICYLRAESLNVGYSHPLREMKSNYI